MMAAAGINQRLARQTLLLLLTGHAGQAQRQQSTSQATVEVDWTSEKIATRTAVRHLVLCLAAAAATCVAD